MCQCGWASSAGDQTSVLLQLKGHLEDCLHNGALITSHQQPPTDPDHERRLVSDQAPTLSRFDLRASTYEDSVLQEFLFDPVHQTVLQLGRRILPRAGAVLDVGCGTGRLLRGARPCYPAAELVGVDLAGQMVATASAVTPSGLRIRYVQARAERLPFPDARFDLVFATLSLRHWADLPVGMAEVARVLRPTGMLVLADIFRDGPRRDPWGRVVRRRRCSQASAELKALLTRQRLELACLERVRWFGLPDVQVLGLQPIQRRPTPVRSRT